jgi:hypothetical protein
MTSGTCKSYLYNCVQTDSLMRRFSVPGLGLTPQMWQEPIARCGSQAEAMRVLTGPYMHQLQSKKVFQCLSCVGAYHYRLKVLFFACFNFFFDFRCGGLKRGEKFSMTPKKN